MVCKLKKMVSNGVYPNRLDILKGRTNSRKSRFSAARFLFFELIVKDSAIISSCCPVVMIGVS